MSVINRCVISPHGLGRIHSEARFIKQNDETMKELGPSEWMAGDAVIWWASIWVSRNGHCQLYYVYGIAHTRFTCNSTVNSFCLNLCIRVVVAVFDDTTQQVAVSVEKRLRLDMIHPHGIDDSYLIWWWPLVWRRFNPISMLQFLNTMQLCPAKCLPVLYERRIPWHTLSWKGLSYVTMPNIIDE